MTIDLTTGPVAAHLRRQSAPMVVGYSAMTAFRAAELYFVAQLGDVPLAAISFTFSDRVVNDQRDYRF